MDETTNDVTTVEATTPVESSTTETKELEVVTEGDPVEVTRETEEEAEPAEKAESDETEVTDEETEAKAEESTDEQKRDANYRIRQLVQENKKLKDTVQQYIKQAEPEYDVMEAIQNGVDPSEARLEALEQKQASIERVAEITELNTTLNQEANDVAKDFPYMDSTRQRTPAEQALADTITQLWVKAADVQTEQGEDGTVFVTQAKESLYDFVKQIDSIRTAAINDGAVQGQRNIEKQLAAVEIPTGRAPKVDRSDDASLSPEEYAKKYNLRVM